MKKLFLATVMFLTVHTAFSQVSYGVKSGLNFANLTNNSGISDVKPFFYAGGFAEFRLNDFFSISPELFYSRQGCLVKESGVKLKLRLNTINLPILARFYVVDNFSIDLGPQVGFMAGSKLWIKYGGQTTTVDLPHESMPVELNSLDVSFALGLTYHLNKFFIQGRYNLGLTDVAKDNSDHSKNSVIQLGVGYRF